MSIVTVLLPNGTKAEANAAREALAKTGWKLAMGTASMHTAGQTLSGDVVLIGGYEPPTLEADVTGKIYRVDSIEALTKLDPSKKQKAAKVEEPKPAEPAPEPASEPEPEAVGGEDSVSQRDLQAAIAKGDELEEMTRVELMQYAAQHWPGERRWAALNNEALRAAIRELGR